MARSLRMATCALALLLAGCGGGSGRSRDIGYRLATPHGGQPQHVAVSAGSQLPANWDRGFNFTAWWHTDYGTQQAAASLVALKATGANSVALTPMWFQATKTSTAIAPDQRTPDDASIRTIVAQAQSLGLKVMFRPLLNVDDGTWRGSIAPADHAAWFASYQAFLDHYADLAKELGVQELSLGAEMGSMASDAARWRALIAEVRSRYSGTLTYGANWDDYMRVSWWDALDEIGIDWYGKLANGETPDEDTIVSAWSAYVNQLSALHAKWNKPIKFTEVGYTSTTTNLVAPQETGGTYDGDAQVRAFNALFRVFADKSWFRGVYIWHWDVWGSNYGPGDTNHPIQNKPAQLTVTDWFSHAATADLPGTVAAKKRLTVQRKHLTARQKRALAKARAAARRRAHARAGRLK